MSQLRAPFVLALLMSSLLIAQPGIRRASITEEIDESRLYRLAANTRPEAIAQNDRGAVPSDFPLEHMVLQLKRSAGDEQLLEEAIDSLHDPASPNFHRWMTAAEFAARFGIGPEDRGTIVQWLESHGFVVHSVAPGGMTIDFSGDAEQIREAFHTEIHYLEVNGARHVANVSDPEIPAALAPAVTGIVSLHDFFPRPKNLARSTYTYSSKGAAFEAVTPGDLAIIYNLNSLFAAGTTGAGQTIAVIEDTDLYASSDWNTFRSTFGLAQYTAGTLTTIHPAPASGLNNCADPHIVAGEDAEAILDAEWASAAAPSAGIEVAACASTYTTFGGFIALQNLVNAKTPPSIVSISYGECEAENGAAANAAFKSVYQQAVAEGISVFVAAGDEGAASCDAGANGATHGIGVSGLASTPYNVAVGGTDFGDTAAGTNSSYWGSANSATYASALSYIPEVPWNDSCASSLMAGFFGFTTVYGNTGFCASRAAQAYGLLDIVAGSGGPSGCATGSPASHGVVGGTCSGYPKPSWQTGVAGIHSDGVRDIPDVSMFAGNGLWGHYYVICWSDVRNGGAPCTAAPSTWGGAGGTSFGAPIMAGVQALINQRHGGAQGNPNYVYYKLAANSANVCNSAGTISGGCMFHNITKADNDVNCGGSVDCYGASSSGASSSGRFGNSSVSSLNGALSTSDQSFLPAYTASTGWNFATGLGTTNAYNLVMNWSSGQ